MDATCPFCKRVERGEYDFSTVGHGVVAFEPLNPVTPGHLLVVPAKHVRDALEDPKLTGEVCQFAAELADGPCNLITSAGSEATQTVFHLHIHLVPRREGDGLALPWTGQRREPEAAEAVPQTGLNWE